MNCIFSLSYRKSATPSGDFPEEAKQFLSVPLLWSRVFAAFTDYLAAYSDLVDRAEQMTWGAKLDSI